MYEINYDVSEEEDGMGLGNTTQNSLQFNVCGRTSRMCSDQQPDYANLMTEKGACHHLSESNLYKDKKEGRKAK